jgi:hypothetical protein
MALIENGGPDLPVAAYTFLGSEPELVTVSPEKSFPGQRMQFKADNSGVVFSLTAYGVVLDTPDRIDATAGRWAAFWNQAALTPGVQEIETSQDVKPLGALYDVANVAVESTSEKSTAILTLAEDILHIDYFVQQVAAFRAKLDAIEAGS